MLTRLRSKLRKNKNKTDVTTPAPKPKKDHSYRVQIPGEPPVILRAANQGEVRQFVRDAHGLTRLPAGTTVERLG